MAGTGDFDGDGKSDIYWRNSTTGDNYIWKSGTGGANEQYAGTLNQNWQVAGTGDYDGDGKSDIYWRNSTTGDNYIWKSGTGGANEQYAGNVDA